MTEKELQALAERHFKKTRKKTFYRIQCDGEQIIVGKETFREMWPGQALIIRKDLIEIDIESSLSIEEMQALAVWKFQDIHFWMKSIKRDDQEDNYNDR